LNSDSSRIMRSPFMARIHDEPFKNGSYKFMSDSILSQLLRPYGLRFGTTERISA
jgi:hypothetical protein